MWIEAPDIALVAQPGQFVMVQCGSFILRRPFSIHQTLPLSSLPEGQIALLFKVAGKGTSWLSQLKTGDKVNVLGPLGNGFSIDSDSTNLLLIAGGIGIAPVTFLAQVASAEYQVTMIHGAKTAEEIYPLPLREGIRFVPITEDGSIGREGTITDILLDYLGWADQMYACGPMDMYKAMAEMSLRAKRSNLKRCQVSLEVRMGCGIGACYGCSIKTKQGFRKICQDGPVFELDDILLEEVKI